VAAVAIAALVLAAASIAGHVGWAWWPLDLVANFRPQLAVLLLVSGVWLALGRWRRTARLVVAVGLIDLLLVGWLWVPAGPDPVAGADRVRVMSYNLFASNERYDEVTAFIAAERPDVVLLHEASLPWEEAVEAAELGYRIVKTRDEEHIFGTLVLVPEGAEVEGFGFTEREPRAVEVVLPLPTAGDLALLGVHPVSPDSEETSALRDAQLAFATNWAEERSGPRVVIGDLNAGPWSHAFRRLVSEGGLRNSQRGFGLQPSFPMTANQVFRVAIDNGAVSPHVAVVDRRLGPPIGSDHAPLILDLMVVRS
jgi:endonuclease/exonuclease/phosphatase (EEP) superfamily protein YafD